MKSLDNIKNCKKLAVMGGTFDPIHYGHLVAAETVREELGVERVLFIPSGRPPHKQKTRVAGDEHRYLMTVLATANNPYFEVSRMEIDRPGMTYTIDTIRALRTRLRDILYYGCGCRGRDNIVEGPAGTGQAVPHSCRYPSGLRQKQDILRADKGADTPRQLHLSGGARSFHILHGYQKPRGRGQVRALSSARQRGAIYKKIRTVPISAL